MNTVEGQQLVSAADTAVGGVMRVTLGDLTSLQLLLGNVLKALTTLSEDVKVLRGDVDTASSAAAKASMDSAQVRRVVTDGHPSRQELTQAVAALQEQHENLSLRVVEYQAASSRDREILVQRIAAIEVQQKIERASTISLEERLGKVEQYMRNDGIQLAARVEELATSQQKNEVDVTNKYSQLQQRVLNAECSLDTYVNEQNNISASIISRVEQSEHLLQHLEQLMDRDRSSLTGSIQRVAVELARNEGIHAQVGASLGKLVDAAIDKKLGDVQVDLERHETALSKKLQHASTMNDVRLEGLKEHVVALSNELSDAKSEVSIFSSSLAQHQAKVADALTNIEERINSTSTQAEDRWQRAKALQAERSQEITNQVNSITDDLLKAVQLGQQETERRVKTLLQNTLEKHDHVVMEQLLSQQKDQSERTHSELDALRQHIEETAGFCRLRLSEQSSHVKALSHLLFVDVDRIPSDPADRLRYLRTLPWCPNNAATGAHHTPVLLDPSFSGNEHSIVSPTLGIEVRNASARDRSAVDGVEVVNVVVDGAAYLSGVRVGDVIVAVADHVILDVQQFAEALRLEASLGRETPRLWLRRDGVSTPERRFFA